MLVLLVVLVAESVATVMFLLHQHTLLTVIQVIRMVMMMMLIMMMMIQDHLTTKLKTSFGVEEDFSSAVSYVQNKVRRAKLRSKHGLKWYKLAKLPQDTNH